LTTNSSSNLIQVLSVNCQVQIIANPDNTTVTASVLSTPITDVRSNDTLNGGTVNSSNTILSFVSTTNSGITLNTITGAISVSPTVPVGTYTLTYKICSIAFPGNCSTGTVTINVCNSPVPNIIAYNDTVSYGNQNRKVNLLENDTFNGVTIPLNSTNISVLQIPNSINPIPQSGGLVISTNGFVSPLAGTNIGTYTIQYRLSYTGSCPTSSNIATVTVTVN
jgi:hypothetical protein